MVSHAKRSVQSAILFAALLLYASHAPAAQADHYLLNATSGTVELSYVEALTQTVDYELERGYSFTFNGIFTRLSVRMPNGQNITYDDRRLQRLHGGTTPRSGFWVLDQNGLRCVSLTDYIAIYQRLKK